VLAAQASHLRKGWLSLPPLPVVLTVDTLTAALKAGRQAPACRAPCAGSSPGRICQIDGQRQSSAWAGEVAVGVLGARQARNCVPKLFHYFELVLLPPLRQPKLDPPPSHAWSSRRSTKTESILLTSRPLPLVGERKLNAWLNETRSEVDAGHAPGLRWPPVLRPPGEEVQRQALSALHQIWIARRTPRRGRGAPRCTQRLRAATSRPAGQGEQAGGAGEEEGEEEEYEVEEILNKQAVKRSSSRTARTAVSWKGSPRDDATCALGDLEGSAALISAYERTVNAS